MSRTCEFVRCSFKVVMSLLGCLTFLRLSYSGYIFEPTSRGRELEYWLLSSSFEGLRERTERHFQEFPFILIPQFPFCQFIFPPCSSPIGEQGAKCCFSILTCFTSILKYRNHGFPYLGIEKMSPGGDDSIGTSGSALAELIGCCRPS